MEKRKSSYTFGLGLILDENFNAVYHRSLLKILLNPILQIFGKVLLTNIETVKSMTDFALARGHWTENLSLRTFSVSYQMVKLTENNKTSFRPFITSRTMTQDCVYIIPNKSKVIRNEYKLKFAVKLFHE